ncbi:MAG: hypothetical protein F2817_21335 [Actinobacteria bacterium]|nr:hypothetical protein [Actinomycetota bacterium]
MKIISARITKQPRPMPEGMFDPMPEIHVTLEDASEEFLFSYYPDEISFTEQELVGLTLDEAKNLKRNKDYRYMRS